MKTTESNKIQIALNRVLSAIHDAEACGIHPDDDSLDHLYAQAAGYMRAMMALAIA